MSNKEENTDPSEKEEALMGKTVTTATWVQTQEK